MGTPDFIPDDQVPQDKTPDFIKDEDIKPDQQAAPDFIPDHELDSDKYSTPGQETLTAVEGLGRGITGGLSDALAVGMRKGATAIGVPDEYLHYVAPEAKDIAGRKEENPVLSTGTELAGNIGLMNKLPQIGSHALNGMIQMGLIAGGDEISKAMLGQGGPASAVASRIAEEGALGLLTGGLFGKVEKLGAKGLAALEKAKIGNKIPSFLSGVGHAATFSGKEAIVAPLEKSAFIPEEIKNFDQAAFKRGQEMYNYYLGSVPKTVGRIAFPLIGGHAGNTGGALAGAALERALEHIAPKISSKYVAPAILKAAASGSVENISHIVDHATQLSKGASKINKGVESIFKAGENAAFNYDTSEKDRERLKEFMETGGIDQEIRNEENKQAQGFADGGEVVKTQQPDEVSKLYPEQHVLLTAAKARISNYLNSVRPVKDPSKLPFDSEHKDPKKDRDYNQALDLALQPLSILKHIKKGTLLPKHMSAFNAMYPDLYQHLSTKITQEMANQHLKKEKKPPYKVRQALSLFLGASLDSTLTPMGIQAAQGVFAKQTAMKNAAAQSQGAISKMDDSSRTPEQARQQRMNKN